MILAQSSSLFWSNTYIRNFKPRIKLFLEYLCDFCNTVSLNERGPKMFPPFSHLLEEKIASFLTHLKSWWNLVLVFGKEHANWYNIRRVMIGRSRTIKSIIFLVNFSKLDFSTSSYHNSTNIGSIGMFFTKNYHWLLFSFSNIPRKMQFFY